MKAMKKVLPLMLGAAIALPVSAAPLKIGMSFQELNNPYFVTIPPRQNSCRPDRIDEQGAMMEERIGSIRTGIQG